MAHHRDTAFHDFLHLIGNIDAAFQLDCLGAGFLDEAGGIGQRLLGADVVGHKRHIPDHHRPLGAPDHRFGMVQHLLQGYRYGRFVTEDHHPQAVSDQDERYAHLINHFRRGVVVGGEHGDFLASLLHFFYLVY